MNENQHTKALEQPTSPAATWLLLERERSTQTQTWPLRHGIFTNALSDWTDADRTRFWYDLAALANHDRRLDPTPCLTITPETFALEERRLQRIVSTITRELRETGGDPHGERCRRPDWCSDPDCLPMGWLRFAEPIIWSFDEVETHRYLVAATAHLHNR